MTRGFTIERKAADAPVLAIGGRFGKFGPEQEKASRKAEVKETEAIRQMKAVWRTWRYDKLWYDERNEFENHCAILQIVENLQYSAIDVEGFSLMLEEFQNENNFEEKAGIFLSALINSGNDSDYIIHTRHLTYIPACLGCFNEKNIIVKGDAGDNIGKNMRGGSITIEGNAGNQIGWRMKDGSITVGGDIGLQVGLKMKNGSITVRGDAEGWIGDGMEGGSITIEGYAGMEVGSNMADGEIRLEGGYMYLSSDVEGGDPIKGGRIYHKGELIVDK
jgi:hypothetical protein